MSRVVTWPPLPVNLDGEIATTTPTGFTVQRNAVHVVGHRKLLGSRGTGFRERLIEAARQDDRGCPP